jgi:hypothetical protein
MHAQELCVTHALGIRTRTYRGDVLDEFPPGKQLRDRVKALASKIMDGKSKARYQKYSKHCREICRCEPRKLELPNETRISGVYKMFESILRSRRTITNYCTTSDEANLYSDVILTDHEWRFLSETLAVLRMTNELAMATQEDSIDSNCFSYYNVKETRHKVTHCQTIRVVNLNSIWDPEEDITKNPTKTILRKRDHLLVDTQNLLDRLSYEYNSYFKNPDSDQVKMMLLHPVMMWRGLR